MDAKKNQTNSVIFDKVVLYSEQVFQDKNKANEWLHRANGALGGKSPIALMETEKGCNEVLDVLSRIEDGVYS